MIRECQCNVLYIINNIMIFIMQVIHAYLGLLKKEKSQQQQNEVFILPCFLHEKWVQRDYLAWLFPKVKFASYSFIMMPICLQHHWLLLVADVKKMTVSILDSLGGDHPEIENKWRQVKVHYLKEHNYIHTNQNFYFASKDYAAFINFF